MSLNQLKKVKVNEIEVDFVALKLFIDNRWHNIEARQLNLLKLLLEHRGQAVSRHQIMDALWHDIIVSDNSVSQAITQLRKSLQDDKETPRFIKTVPRVGYQLIADIEYPENKTAQINAPAKKITLLVGFISSFIGILITLIVLNLSKQDLHVPSYQYESRLTAIPGPENFLRYSPNGRYLAFSQTSDDQSQMDLAIYDAQTQAIHSIKHTGYNEEAAEWSPDGNWLIYYRHDPISCGIRIMSVINPIETWRLSVDRPLTPCTPGVRRQKMHWLNDNSIYLSRWHNNQTILTKLTLSVNPSPKVESQEDFVNISPILMDIDKNSLKMLLVEKPEQQYQLKQLDLINFEQTLIEEREQAYLGLKWHETNKSFWLGNENLTLMSLSGHDEIARLPMGFITDIDVNPITQQLAHAEGLVNVNLYTLSLTSLNSKQDLDSKQLSSAARTDILPTISKDGSATAFISYQRRSIDGLRHGELWLKNKYKKTASLLTNIDENIHPQYLLWSPNGENLLLGDSNYKLFLVNIFSKHMIPIIADYQHIDAVNWSSDGKFISFSAQQQGEKQNWQYDLKLNTTELITPRSTISALEQKPTIKQLVKMNPSYRHYLAIINRFLTTKLIDTLPVDNLLPSLNLYRPYVFQQGIYYVIKQGQQLSLYLYSFTSKENILITDIGQHQQDIHLLLTISASADGKQLAFSKVEGFETDILVQRKVVDNNK